MKVERQDDNVVITLSKEEGEKFVEEFNVLLEYVPIDDDDEEERNEVAPLLNDMNAQIFRAGR